VTTSFPGLLDVGLLDVGGRVVVAVALGWAAVAKLADLPLLRATLYLSRLTRPWVPQLVVLLPGVELLLGAGLLGARAGWGAAAAAAVLLVAFVGYLALDPSAAEGCTCFGSRTTTSRRTAVLRDLLLLAALVPALGRGPGAGRWGVPAAAEPWAALLAVAGLGAVLAWAFRRAPGRARGSAPAGTGGRAGARAGGRRRAGVPVAPPADPPRLAPPFDVAALDGGRLELAALAARPGGVLLVFVEPGCVLCDTVLPEVADLAGAVVLAAVEAAGDAVTWAADHHLSPARTAADVGGAIADAYRVPGNPAAARVGAAGVLVDAAGEPVRRLAVGPDAVRALARGTVTRP